LPLAGLPIWFHVTARKGKGSNKFPDSGGIFLLLAYNSRKRYLDANDELRGVRYLPAGWKMALAI